MHPQLQEQERWKTKISMWNNCRSLASAETAHHRKTALHHQPLHWELGLGHCVKGWTPFVKGGESEIRNQRNSLKTDWEKHYPGALGLLLSWIKHHDPITSRFLWAPLIPAQEIDFHLGQSQTSPSPLPQACPTWCGLDSVVVQLLPPTHCPWSCSGNSQ